ncbi:Transcription factor [Penicillium antarcticum]|uniref:Transcription factor n=1 Tax=Penicillium antarcticum TaxID=416450 RepID=UPI002389DB27|nr:Transcription factor [Penicillium antarcticum]KAJ5297882.1 Transcription factor [Penicillium antarcticum]
MESRFARFACDFCRHKKLKCSRELPKCSNCKPWPSSCNYLRDKSSSTPPASNPIQQASEPESTFGLRLQRLENTVQQLANSVDQALQAIRPISSDKGSRKRPSSTQDPISQNNISDSKLYIGPSHSFSFLKEASANIDAIAQPAGDDTRQSAHSELQYLSNSLTTARVEQQKKEDSNSFFIPSRAIGYRLISQIFGYAELGEPFFTLPSEDVLRQVVFEPQNVRMKAWVVYFNYMILSVMSNETGESDETSRFRRNMQLALNDSSVFLEPRHVNVQALVFLAMHGEDYAAPNLSWMLLGHACRQAEALGIHLPYHQPPEHRQQRLCLFWMLFLIDKSCSLAFGRPAFLPTALYQNVPLPDPTFILKFNPHERVAFGGQQGVSKGSQFGAEVLMRSIQWAKLAGVLSDLLSTGDSSNARVEIRSKLERWYLETDRALTEILRAESTSADVSQIREMSLGISSIKFQYLHSLILLLKGDESSSALRLFSAREAISILSSMVSNWSSVYNGVVWQLLYCPFTPFFVVFDNIIHPQDYHTATIDQDLELLSVTVNYFKAMQSQMRLLATVCSRLEHTAAIFLKLAQNHVSHRASAKTTAPAAPHKQSASHQNYNQALADLMDLDVSDMSNHIEWLPVDMDTTWPLPEAEKHDPVHSRPADRGQMSSNMFDWFSWDSYYAGTEA